MQGYNEFCFEYVLTVEVKARLKQLKSKKATGHDDSPPDVIKSCSECLAQPLTYVINISLSTGIFPDKWKVAKVVPLYKGGESGNFERYRAISILQVMAKITEGIVRKGFPII